MMRQRNGCGSVGWPPLLKGGQSCRPGSGISRVLGRREWAIGGFSEIGLEEQRGEGRGGEGRVLTVPAGCMLIVTGHGRDCGHEVSFPRTRLVYCTRGVLM